jgi:hypothetical protein
MNLIRLTALAFCFALAPALLAQQKEAGPGDLIPRTGTIAYMVSDHPDALYRLFGRDAKNGWKLRSFAESMLNKEHSDNPESEDAQRDRAIFDYVFGGYEALERVEIGLIDVTLDGPKYILVLHTKKGESIDAKPDFLADFLTESHDYKGVKYYLYRAPVKEEERAVPPDNPDKDKDPGDEPIPMPEEEPRNALGDKTFGMDRFYVASTSRGLLVSNFESSMREAIDRLSSGDYSESLSGREEFAEWIKSRKPHDLSVFIIGREIQNAIERVIPSEEQAGLDAEGIYKEVDKWFQFREYKWIVFDADYEDAARGITVAASFKTRRPTKLLEKLAIEPADFKLLKYVPEGSIFTAGMQLGDAKTTFTNLKELAFDVEKWAMEIQEGMRGGTEPPMPPDGPDMPEEDEMGPKSIKPGNFFKGLQEMGEEGEEGEGESKVDEALAELEKMLGEYGTSTDELLSVLGTEVVVFSTPNAARAKAAGRSDFGGLMETSDIGVALAIKDIAKARAIIARGREKDPEGVFRGFEAIPYQGRELQVTTEHPYGYAFTDDALLVVICLGVNEDDATAPVISGLKAMVDASTRTSTGASFVKNGSKFIEVDFGAASRITNTLSEDLSKRLDRYAQPPIDKDPTSVMTDLTLALRLKEAKDGVELAVRVAGLPDFGQFLDGDMKLFGGANANRNGYNYSEDNLRTLFAGLQSSADAGETPNLDAMLKGEVIRKGNLQVPFDARWKGGIEKLGWTRLDQVVRDSEGNLPEWVDKDAAALIEQNENEGFRSIVLAQGDIAAWIKDYKTGFIVAYQENADTLGGHMVLYADGQIGWLSSAVFKQALDLNAKGEPVPGEETWHKEGKWEEPRKIKPEGPRMKEDDPWYPGPK